MAEATVRVQQLAATMHVPISQAVDDLKASGLEVRSGSDRLSHEQVAQALKSFRAALDPQLARPFIVEAYAAARDSGRPDWWVMPQAVLKNRILDLTGREFNEVNYGAPTFGYFVSLFPDLLTSETSESGQLTVSVERSAMSERKELAAASDAPVIRGRIREDLWDAFADFTTGNVYVWDVASGVARPGTPSAACPAIPTLTPAEESSWRTEFVGAVSKDVTEKERVALSDWQERRLPSTSLPIRLKGVWNGRLRARMVSKIRAFFDEHSLVVPEDLMVDQRNEHTHGGRVSRSVTADDLRALVQRCVAVMTDDELRALSVPVHVVLRAISRQ